LRRTQPQRSQPRQKPRRSRRRSRRGSSSDEDSGTEVASFDDSDEESAQRRHRRSGSSRVASRRERRHGPLQAPHPLTPPVLYGSRSAAPAPYNVLLSPPGSPLQPSLHAHAPAGQDWHAAAAMLSLAASGRMPRPSAPPDPGYSLTLSDHAYITHINGLFAPSGGALAVNRDGDDEMAAVMAAARLVEAYVQRRAAAEAPPEPGSPARQLHSAAPPAAVWPAFSPPQAPSRARTPQHKPARASAGRGSGRMPAPLPTREQALRSLARELDAASAESGPVAAVKAAPHVARHREDSVSNGSSEDIEAQAEAVELEDAFEDFIDGDAEWLAACRAEAAQRQRSPSLGEPGPDRRRH